MVTVRTVHHASLEVESVRRDGVGVSVREENTSLWRDSVKVLKIFFFFCVIFFLCNSTARISTDAAIRKPLYQCYFCKFCKEIVLNM